MGQDCAPCGRPKGCSKTRWVAATSAGNRAATVLFCERPAQLSVVASGVLKLFPGYRAQAPAPYIVRNRLRVPAGHILVGLAG